jgi:predicted nucleic acid-binding protein
MEGGGAALIVVDTMIFAYALVCVDGLCDDAAAVLEVATRIAVPDSLRAELANVVWQWCTHRDLSLEIGRSVLDDADALISHTVPANYLWHRALEISSEVRHPVYDTLFVAAAERFDTRLVTADQRLLALFPTITVSPAGFLAQ